MHMVTGAGAATFSTPGKGANAGGAVGPGTSGQIGVYEAGNTIIGDSRFTDNGSLLDYAGASGINIPTGSTYQIGGLQIAASNLSNGTTGTGAVVLASAIAGFGDGTVTSVAFPTTPAWLTAAVTNATTTPSITLTATSGLTANEFLATPNGSSGAVGLRGIVAADLPTIPQTQTTVTFVTKTGNYLATSGDSGTTFNFNSSLNNTLTLPASAPPSGWWISVIVNGTGSVTIYPNGLNLDGTSANQVLEPSTGNLIYSDGSSYWLFCGSVGLGAINQIAYYGVAGGVYGNSRFTENGTLLNYTGTSGFNIAAGTTYQINNTQISAANLSNGTTGSGAVVLATAWTNYSPSISAGSGTFTSVSATGRYIQIGTTVFFTTTIAITTNGTAGSWVTFSLPTTPSSNFTYWQCQGRESSVSGKVIAGTIVSGAPNVNVNFYDNTYPGADGANLILCGFYETA